MFYFDLIAVSLKFRNIKNEGNTLTLNYKKTKTSNNIDSCNY